MRTSACAFRTAVATTLGVGLYDTSSKTAPPSALATFTLSLKPGGVTLVPLKADGFTAKVCKALDDLFGDGTPSFPRTATLARVDATRLLLARGPMLLDLDLREPTTPSVASMLVLPTPIRALRVDDLRAYAAPDWGPWLPARVVELRGGALKVVGTHDVVSWVERHDEGAFALRRTGAFGIEIARLAR